MRLFLMTAALALPSLAFAAGSDDSTPPQPTKTTKECKSGEVWSDDSNACVNAQSGALDDDTLYGAAREFAYAGQYQNALQALAAMSDPLDDRVLTYKGFAHRKMGDAELGNAFYAQAIARNPDNLLARSYMGQGFAALGDIVAAKTQLAEIRARGGRGTWPEVSLRMAIESGKGFNY